MTIFHYVILFGVNATSKVSSKVVKPVFHWRMCRSPGNTLAHSMAPSWVRRCPSTPCHPWSWRRRCWSWGEGVPCGRCPGLLQSRSSCDQRSTQTGRSRSRSRSRSPAWTCRNSVGFLPALWHVQAYRVANWENLRNFSSEFRNADHRRLKRRTFATRAATRRSTRRGH